MSLLTWMSFCDDSKPEGEQHLGVILCAGDFAQAWITINVKGINPGGEISAYSFDYEAIPRGDPMLEMPLDTLFTKQELVDRGFVQEAGNAQ